MSLEQTFQQIQKKKFWQDKEMLFLVGESIFLNLMVWVYILINFLGANKFIILGREIILHRNILIGEIIGFWPKLLIYPLLGLGILLVNLFLIFYFYLRRQKKIVNLLAFGLLLVQVIFLFSVLLVIHF
ncbi:MAG: hypothetical protein PHW15_03160 [Patescibacteria group bacterium]|nr:hypothetical protein [Patescibacteria group bacterium]